MNIPGRPVWALLTSGGLLLAACAVTPGPVDLATPTPHSSTVGATEPAQASQAPSPTIASTCQPTDQDAYVYNPDRLEIVAACIRVTGTVEDVRTEADGDLHILLIVAPPFEGLLKPSNEGEELGDLVVEPVCVRRVTQDDAKAVCAPDSDPIRPPLPRVGQRVWIEGRYVLDSDHDYWAELHPLYRWGLVSGGGGSIPTPAPTNGSTSGGFYRPSGWDGHSDVDCADFDTHAHAESFFLGTGGSRTNDPYRLDGDHDGQACETLP